jgi:hypothetical protein
MFIQNIKRKVMNYINISTLGAIFLASTALQASFTLNFTEQELLYAMQESGATSFNEAEVYLRQQLTSSAAPMPAQEEVSLYGFTEVALLQAMAEQGLSDYHHAAQFLRRQQARLNEAFGASAPRQSAAATASPMGQDGDRQAQEISTIHKRQLVDLWKSAQQYDNVDVHYFNQRWAKQHFSEVQNIFTTTYGNPEAKRLSFDTLKQEILSCARNYRDELVTAFNILSQHGGNQGYADHESGVSNTLMLLSQNWYLASNATGRSRKFQFQFGNQIIEGNSRDFIIHSLLENKRTNGGCAPGYAGRFVRDLLLLLCVQANISE